MGNRSSAKREEEDEFEEEEETEDGESEEEDTSMFEERTEEEKVAAEAAWEAKLRAKPVATAAAPKKKATAAVDFAALAAAKAKKAAAAKKAPATKAPSAAPQEQEDSSAKPAVPAGDGDLPQGEEGSEWEALADALIRQERDVKSVKRGAVQNGERVTQTGPWRADPTGRVRMPVRGPRGVFGWVSLDERRCQNAMGEFGTQLFEFVGKQAAAPEVVPAPAPSPPSSAAKAKAKSKPKTAVKAVAAAAPAARADELADLLDEWGISDDEAPESGGESDGGDEELGAGPVDSEEPEIAPSPVPSAAAPQAGAKPSAKAAAKAAAGPEGSLLTDTEKALRSLRKKLRELDDLEAKGNLTEAQQQKLAAREELRQKEVFLVGEVKRENRKAKEAAKIEAGGAIRKRPKQKKGAAGTKGSSASTKSSSSMGAMVVLAVVVAVAACAAALHFSQ